MGAGDLFLDRYRVVRRVAEDPLAVVLEAVDERLDRRVAIKRMRISKVHDEDAVAQFTTEVSRALAIGGVHTVEVFDEGSYEGAPYAVVELLDAVSLEHALGPAGSLPAGVAAEIGIRVCDALDRAHQRSIVHGGLAAANILVTRTEGAPEVKLVGFAPPTTAFRDHRGDLTALAKVLRRALGVSDPFEDEPGRSPGDAGADGASERPPRVDEELVAVVTKALSSDRRDRFQSSRSLRAALAPFADQDAFLRYPFFRAYADREPAPGPEVGARSAERATHHRWRSSTQSMVAVASVLVVMMVAMVCWLVWSGRR